MSVLPRELRTDTRAYLDRLRTGPGRYRMTPELEGSLFTDCFAFFLRHLLGDEDDGERRAFAERVLSAQDAATGLWRRSGHFSDGAPLHDRDHVDRQLTSYALAALTTLGLEPRHPLRFLEPWRAPEGVVAELQAAPWARSPSNAGNRAMFLATFLCSASRQPGGAAFRESLEAWFEWHDTRARPRTGFWGEGPLADGYLGLTGAAHQYVHYRFAEREPPRLDRALDRTLALQYRDGRFWPVPGGGSCYELDAAQILLAGHAHRPQRRAAISDACRRMLGVILDSRLEDGSFCWARRRPLSLRELLFDLSTPQTPIEIAWALYMRLKAARRRAREMRATPWTSGTHAVWEGSLFDTWFRLLSLALIARMAEDPRLPVIDWRALPAASWGHF